MVLNKIINLKVETKSETLGTIKLIQKVCIWYNGKQEVLKIFFNYHWS